NQAVTLVKSVANKILSADLLTSNTTPIVIKTAGGAGILDKPTEGWIYLDFGIAYTTYTTLELVSGSTVVGTCNCLGLTTSGWYPIVFSGTPEENAALSIRTQTDDPPGGTSNIAYDISYEEKDVSIFSFPVNIEFGENVLLPSTTTNDNRKGQQVIVPFDCDISSLTFYQEGGAASNILVSVYDNVADEPLNRLGLSASTPIDGAPGWQTVPLITPVSVSAGDVIWLNWVPDGQLVYGFESPTSGLKWIGSNTYTFPDPIDGPVTTAAASYNIYCNAIRT
ncbi:hypothetical protein KAR91_76760, partial [Candidatus Pacearchaeota archaeon]|nr:hypothetical protein [Candidatus Pacearchaeota archaeon]